MEAPSEPAGATGDDADSGAEKVLHAMVVPPPPPAEAEAPPLPEDPRKESQEPPLLGPPPAPEEADLPRTVHRPRPTPPRPPTPPPEQANRRRTVALAGGSVAIAVVVVALVAAVAGGGSDTHGSSTVTTAVGSTSPSSAPATTATPTTVAVTTTVTAAPRPFPVTTLLPSGFYATSAFQPRFTATLGDGWRMDTERADDIEFGRGDSDTEVLSFLKPRRVLPDDGRFTTAAAVARAGASQPAPADFVAWLRSHSRLRVTATTPVTRAGVQGVQVDVVVTDGYASQVCLQPCVPMFPLDEDGAVFHLVAGHNNRLYVLTVGGEQVLVAIEAAADRFGTFVQEADRFVDTVAFKG